MKSAVPLLAAAALLAGCGHAAKPAAPRASATARPASAERLVPLVYVWRNFEFTGIPEEMTVYTNNEVRYRNLLHTQMHIKTISDTLDPVQAARLRRLLAATDLDRADASGVRPRRSGFRYIVRSRGHTGTAADGHLKGHMGQLVRTLGATMDRLSEGSL